ncbi:MAG TPA: GNAT family N-acetyltransferase [Anaerolineales bacterium]|jgi:predicted N-acetyltransferase YhbS
MTSTSFAVNVVTQGRMRPLNVLRDLPAVADLIELCFSSTLDPEGRSYIDQMRRSGRDSSFLRWAPRVIETVSLPLSGFVWENNGRVVGNVSLIPFSRYGKKIFLVANVATHPDFRRQGIARQLTAAAMQRAREKHAHSIWLHVRDDNPGAIQLYEQLGFVERTRRTSWSGSRQVTLPSDPPANIQVMSRQPRDWLIQSEWLSRAYPPDLNWYHTQTWDILKPGLVNALYRFLTDTKTLQWTGYRQGSLLGVLGCQRTPGHSDHLWAALPVNPDAEVVTALFQHARRTLNPSRGVVLEYPTGIIDEAIQAAGFTPQRTLAWMQAPGSATFQKMERKLI